MKVKDRQCRAPSAVTIVPTSSFTSTSQYSCFGGCMCAVRFKPESCVEVRRPQISGHSVTMLGARGGGRKRYGAKFEGQREETGGSGCRLRAI